MAFQFPPSPTVNQTFTPVAGTTYRWSGTAWHLLAGPGAFITQADADTRYVNVAGDTMTGALLHGDGTLAAPGISWATSPSSGFHHYGGGVMAYSVAGTQTWSCSSTAFVLPSPMSLTVGGRLNVSGELKASSTGAFEAGAGAHEVLQHVDTVVAFLITHQGNVDPLGLSIKYNNYNARSPGDLYLQFNDANGALGYFTGNGGMVNYKANDGDISDARLKRDISDAPDYTALVGKLAFRRFSYLDQPEMGAVDNVIAQELEALAPELIGPNLAGTEFKTIYSDRLQQRINSVIPRLIARINALEEKLAALENP